MKFVPDNTAEAVPLLEHVINSLPASTVRVDQSGLITAVTAEAEQLFQVHAPDVLGTPVTWLLEACADKVFQPDDAQTLCLAATGWAVGVRAYRIPVRRSTGEQIQVSVHSYFTGNADRYSALLLVEQLHSSDPHLRSTRQNLSRFQTLTRLAPVGILELDPEWRCCYANDKWCELSRLGQEESHDGGWVDCFHPDDVSEALLGIHDAVSNLETCERELRLQTPLGEVTWVSLSATGLFGPGQRVEGFLVVVTDITERYQANEQLRHIALRDTLTGLHNRGAFLQRLQYATSAESLPLETALLFLDLDGFKAINDTLGHHAGDALLVQVAERLEGIAQPGDTVARLGGDEFTMILPRRNARESAEQVASGIVSRLKEPYQIDGQQVRISASIGIAICDQPTDSQDMLVRQADVALYRAKHSGRAQHVFFSPELDRARRDHSMLVSRLQIALLDEEFELHYQPQLDVITGRVVGFEALIRWPDTPSPDISTDEIIAALEDNGMIGPVGEWVLDQACSDWRDWRTAKLIDSNARLSVNVSARQLSGAEFLQRFEKILDNHNMPADQLVVEITESEAINSLESGVINELKAMGVSISIDDFGTGFSSFAYLSQLPVDEIKIDKSFIRDMGQHAQAVLLVEGILALAQSLGLAVVAEGVEDISVLPVLAKAGCATYQGFLYSRPVNANGIAALLAEPNAATERESAVKPAQRVTQGANQTA